MARVCRVLKRAKMKPPRPFLPGITVTIAEMNASASHPLSACQLFLHFLRHDYATYILLILLLMPLLFMFSCLYAAEASRHAATSSSYAHADTC